MDYLLDTHVILWIALNDNKLSKKARNIFLNQDNRIYLSLISIWEIAIKCSIGKLELGESIKGFVKKYVEENDIEILRPQLADVVRIEKLPFFHRDPFDRLIITQALENNCNIISRDKTFDQYPVKRIW